MHTSRVLRSLGIATVSLAIMVAGSAAQYATTPIPEPVAFEARWSTDQSEAPEAWAIEGVDPLHGIDGSWPVEVLETSDPRLDGAIVYEFNDDEYRSVDLHVHHSSFTITNAAGAWRERPAVLLARPDTTSSTRTGVFVGEGSYEGLMAVAEITWDRAAWVWDVSGYLISGDIPPLPGEGELPE